MKIPDQSFALKELCALERRLSQGELSLDEIRSIEDELFFQVTEKTKGAVENVFSKVEKKREEALGRELEKRCKMEDLSSKIETFCLSRALFSPEELQEKIGALEFEAGLLENNPAIQAVFQERLKELDFSLAYPVVQELDPNSIESNFLSRMRKIQEKVLAENSLEPLLQLSASQREEILAYARQGGAK